MTVLWIRIGFDTDLNPAPGSQTNTDPEPDPGHTLPSPKVKFLHEKYTLFWL
jgi:hypothetical protein